MTSYVLKCYCRLITRYRPQLSSGTEGKITSLGDTSLTTRLGHNRKENRAELIPLTEIYMNVKQRLGAENAAQLYCY